MRPQPGITKSAYRTTLKFAVVSLPAILRSDLRHWIDAKVGADGSCSEPAPTLRHWKDVVQAAVIFSEPADRAWLRAWTLKWVRRDGGVEAPAE